MSGVIQAWKAEGEWLVGQKDGTRIHRKRLVGRPDEISPGVARLPKDEDRGVWTWADGVYEHKVRRFRRMGKDIKHPRRIRWHQRYRAKLSIKWHRLGYRVHDTRLSEWHRDRMRRRWG